MAKRGFYSKKAVAERKKQAATNKDNGGDRPPPLRARQLPRLPVNVHSNKHVPVVTWTRGKGKVPDKERFASRNKQVRDLDDLVKDGKLPAYKEIKDVVNEEKEAILYMATYGIIRIPTCCGRCNSPCKWKGPEQVTMRCRKQNCEFTCPADCERCGSKLKNQLDTRGDVFGYCPDCDWIWNQGQSWERSIYHGSVLQNCRLPKNEVLHLFYLYLMRVPTVPAALMLGWTVEVVGKWMRHCRQLVAEMVIQEDRETIMLGGPGIIVEIDESKFGKRKYNKGRRVTADWVLGMVERTEQRKLAMIAVPRRTANVLIPLITAFVRPGSVIHTDQWKAYNRLGYFADYNYTHKTLCHKKEFVAKDGTHTQTIEGSWSFMKKKMPVQKRSGHNLQEYLWEVMWMRQHEKGLWDAFLRGLSKFRYTPAEIERLWDLRDESDPAGWNEEDYIQSEDEDELEYDTDDEEYESDGEGTAAAATLLGLQRAVI
ncbi:Inherit from opiNOG: protein Hydra magnipapillata [Seminavis robusta]|uniref:Inherit from opiNOG: protein Hydra magnipapillata n=1 Tax=Seminavis robusta TaxID=568900 RepID=A0A9N8ENJ6_9STRA|nr:Inherit from opiNOG: protein Hydra magnipapillata [Seminavis robusta]|eukprot:Sro1395_g269030.1 Inherit from opiNOG: protein Hydra magnipapillata (484) ;mRNA; r:5101-6552